jgi:archaemetzincin
MQQLQSQVRGDGSRLLGLIGRDLYLPMLSFVFGHAQLEGPVALVSLARLRQEFYGLRPDPDRLRQRAETEVAHELGHTFGLRHCEDSRCCMSLSTSIEEVDGKQPGFCRSCRVRLRQWRVEHPPNRVPAPQSEVSR